MTPVSIDRPRGRRGEREEPTSKQLSLLAVFELFVTVSDLMGGRQAFAFNRRLAKETVRV